MNKFISGILFLLLLVSCKNKPMKQVDVSGVEVTVSVNRFDQEFYNTTPETLPKIKESYPFLFPEQTLDSVWINRIQDTDEIELFDKAQQVFGDFSSEAKNIEDLYKHIKYYYPTFKEPVIFTLITNLDFKNKVMYAEDFLFISLDMYLGKDSEVYHDFPIYLSQNFDKSQLTVDIGKAIGAQYFMRFNNRQFIDLIINEGKKMYQLDCFLPNATDAQKMGYSNEKLAWVEENETYIWKYFIENKLLYSTDKELYSRFVEESPFSKFFMEIDQQSPGKVGVWLGWQIVRSYMKNNNVTLHQLIRTDANEIFKKSKYKPKK